MPKFDDDYHRLVREKQMEIYYLNGGRVKEQIRNYSKRYNLKDDFLNDCPNDEEKIKKLKQYALDFRMLKHEQKIAAIKASHAVAPCKM